MTITETAPTTGSLPRVLRDRPLGWFLLVSGLIGWLASLELAHGKIQLLENPQAALSCDINPLLSCSSVMGHWQSELLGFPNPFIGIAAFVVPMMIGALLVSGAVIPRWMRLGLQIGLLAGVALVTFLQHASLFAIGIGCPWCMVVWAVTIPQFVLFTSRNVLDGTLGEGIRASALARVVASQPLTVAGLWLFLVLAAALYAFRSAILILL